MIAPPPPLLLWSALPLVCICLNSVSSPSLSVPAPNRFCRPPIALQPLCNRPHGHCNCFPAEGQRSRSRLPNTRLRTLSTNFGTNVLPKTSKKIEHLRTSARLTCRPCKLAEPLGTLPPTPSIGHRVYDTGPADQNVVPPPVSSPLKQEPGPHYEPPQKKEPPGVLRGVCQI